MKISGEGLARNIVLTGFMGTGKTTVGLILAGRLSWSFVDTDALIELRSGRAIADIINQDGEMAFRHLERDACQQVAAKREQVVATGGGALLDPANRAALSESGLVVCLTCNPAEIVRRLNGDQSRPLLAGNPVARIQELLAARKPIYDALPNHVDTTRRTPEEVANEVLALWHQT
jgi:shikimate kinase